MRLCVLLLLILNFLILFVGCKNTRGKKIEKDIINLFEVTQENSREKTIKLSDKLLEHYPTDIRALNAVTQSYLSSDETAKAFISITTALKEQIDITFSLKLLSLCYFSNGNSIKANKIAELALELENLIEKRVKKYD